MSIYNELIEMVDNGKTFRIDFENRTMKVGGKYLIKKDTDYTMEDLFGKNWQFHEYYDLYSVLRMIRLLYKNYKYSLPSERSENKRRKYFKALPIEKMTDEQLMVAEKREIAQARLEGFVLCMIISGQLVWDEDIMKGKWFYQAESDPDLIILRQWIENKNN